MKKRIISFLLVMIMLIQIITVASPTTKKDFQEQRTKGTVSHI